MNDRDLFYQILERYIDNIVVRGGPMFSLFSGPIKNWIFSFLEPYLNAFLLPGSNELNTNAIKAFANKEVNSKIEEFLKEFNSEKNDYGKRNS